jgi:L-2-hydroxyglutarate oxidase LhgO
VIGLAVARALALAGRAPLLLEKNAHLGEETSSRNSEVIHAGLYYAEGSLKGRLCVEGKQQLYDFCAARRVPHRNTGKLIVAAVPGELAALERIDVAARANGVEDLVFLDRIETLRREPALDVAGALWSPTTGIIDSHGYMLALLGEAEAHGAEILRSATVLGGEIARGGGARLRVRGVDGAEIGIRARAVVNAAGLWAQRVAASLEGIDPTTIPAQHLVKGSYFALAGRAPFSTLVYPAPSGGGLGVHLTLDIGGRARFGPDTEWLDDATPETLDYAVDRLEDVQPRHQPGRQTRPADLIDEGLAAGRVELRPVDAPAQLQQLVAGVEDRLEGLAEHVGLRGGVGLGGAHRQGLHPAPGQ